MSDINYVEIFYTLASQAPNPDPDGGGRELDDWYSKFGHDHEGIKDAIELALREAPPTMISIAMLMPQIWIGLGVQMGVAMERAREGKDYRY